MSKKGFITITLCFFLLSFYSYANGSPVYQDQFDFGMRQESQQIDTQQSNDQIIDKSLIKNALGSNQLVRTRILDNSSVTWDVRNEIDYKDYSLSNWETNTTQTNTTINNKTGQVTQTGQQVLEPQNYTALIPNTSNSTKNTNTTSQVNQTTGNSSDSKKNWDVQVVIDYKDYSKSLDNTTQTYNSSGGYLYNNTQQNTSISNQTNQTQAQNKNSTNKSNSTNITNNSSNPSIVNSNSSSKNIKTSQSSQNDISSENNGDQDQVYKYLPIIIAAPVIFVLLLIGTICFIIAKKRRHSKAHDVTTVQEKSAVSDISMGYSVRQELDFNSTGNLKLEGITHHEPHNDDICNTREGSQQSVFRPNNSKAKIYSKQNVSQDYFFPNAHTGGAIYVDPKQLQSHW